MTTFPSLGVDAWPSSRSPWRSWLAPHGDVGAHAGGRSYPIADVWPAPCASCASIAAFPIREKDDDAGYILFDYTDGPKPARDRWN
jgi:hypothetical protein